MPAVQAPSSKPSNPPPDERVRLHISPLSPDLLKAYLGPSLPKATNISYHELQTFPEKNYGYVELPMADATKLRKKLNGSILKGSKVSVADARPEKQPKKKRKKGDDTVDLDDRVAADGDPEKEERKSKRAKKEKLKITDKVLDGVELPKERKVKRGWTEPVTFEKKSKDKKKDKSENRDKKKKTEPSKYTKEPELLFRTQLPPNKADIGKKEKGQDKKVKKEKSGREVVVHEFEKSQRHATFLKSSQLWKDGKVAADYVEGKGWVDAEGNIVEEESGRLKQKHERDRLAAEKAAAAAVAAKESEASLDKSSASDAKETISKSALRALKTGAPKSIPSITVNGKGKKVADTEPAEISSEESSVVSSDSSSDGSSDQDDSEDDVTDPTPKKALREMSISEPPLSSPQQTEAAAELKEVHPLEALYKRPRPDPTKLAPITTSFSFFDAEVEDECTEAHPQTPFTRQDREWRGIRSAAPTPDTAAIGKKFKMPWHDEDDDEDEDEAMDVVAEEDEAAEEASVNFNATPPHEKRATRSSALENTELRPESEFAKRFWEQRGDKNRGWKKARKDANKLKRQRENKRLARRIV